MQTQLHLFCKSGITIIPLLHLPWRRASFSSWSSWLACYWTKLLGHRDPRTSSQKQTVQGGGCLVCTHFSQLGIDKRICSCWCSVHCFVWKNNYIIQHRQPWLTTSLHPWSLTDRATQCLWSDGTESPEIHSADPLNVVVNSFVRDVVKVVDTTGQHIK